METAGDNEKSLHQVLVPQSLGQEQPFYICQTCKENNKCPCCRLAFIKKDWNKKKKLSDVDTDWRCIPVEQWVKQKRAKKGTKPKEGFVPCSEDSIHKTCAGALRNSASKSNATSATSNQKEKRKEKREGGGFAFSLLYMLFFKSHTNNPTTVAIYLFYLLLFSFFNVR